MVNDDECKNISQIVFVMIFIFYWVLEGSDQIVIMWHKNTPQSSYQQQEMGQLWRYPIHFSVTSIIFNSQFICRNLVTSIYWALVY